MTTQLSGNKLIARNTAFLYIRMAIILIVTLYTSRVILNVLGVIDYGVYNVVAGFVSMFAFLNASFVATIQRFYNYEIGQSGKDGIYKVYKTAIVIQIVLAIVILVLTETIGLWYLNNKLVIPIERMAAARVLFHCSVVSMMLVILQVPFSAMIMAFERMDYYAIVGIIDILLKLFIVIILKFFLTDKLIAYAILLLCVSIIVFSLYCVYARINLLSTINKTDFSFEGCLFKSMLSFSAWSMLGAFAQVVRNQGLNIILNLFFGPVVNAARGISYQIKGALSGFIANIQTSVRPQLVSSYSEGNKARSFRLMYSISKICFFFLFLMALPICIEMDYILRLWLGNVVPEFTSVFSRLILCIALIDVLNGPVSMIMYASGKIGLYNVITSVIGLLVLPFSYILLKLGNQPYVVYIFSLIISVFVQIASVIIMKCIVGVRVKDYISYVILPTAIVVVLATPLPVISHYIMEQSLTRLLVVILSSILTVGLSTYFVGLNRSEQNLLISFLKIKKQRQ